MVKNETTIMSIIENTVQLLNEKKIPFEKLSVSDICVANSITKPTFYKYIGSKEAVLEYYYRMIFHQLADQYLSRDYDDPRTGLLEGFSLYTKAAEKMGVVLYRTFITIVLKNNIEADALQEELINRFHEFYRACNLNVSYEELVTFSQQQQFGMSYFWVMTNGSFDLQNAYNNQFNRFLGENQC